MLMRCDRGMPDPLILLAGAVAGAVFGLFGAGGAAFATPMLALAGVPGAIAVATPLPALLPASVLSARRQVRVRQPRHPPRGAGRGRRRSRRGARGAGLRLAERSCAPGRPGGAPPHRRRSRAVPRCRRPRRPSGRLAGTGRVRGRARVRHRRAERPPRQQRWRVPRADVHPAAGPHRRPRRRYEHRRRRRPHHPDPRRAHVARPRRLDHRPRVRPRAPPRVAGGQPGERAHPGAVARAAVRRGPGGLRHLVPHPAVARSCCRVAAGSRKPHGRGAAGDGCTSGVPRRSPSGLRPTRSSSSSA